MKKIHGNSVILFKCKDTTVYKKVQKNNLICWALRDSGSSCQNFKTDNSPIVGQTLAFVVKSKQSQDTLFFVFHSQHFSNSDGNEIIFLKLNYLKYH